MEPYDIDHSTILGLKIFLIDTNKISNFIDSYDSLIEKTFGKILGFRCSFS